MAIAIRLSRGGRKNRPHYSIVVADKRMPRDGRFIEKIGSYNPLLNKDDANRVILNAERAAYWVGQGAIPSDRVATFLGKAGVTPMPAQRNNPNKAQPSDKTKMLVAEKAKKKEAAAEAAAQAEADAKAAAAAPAEEAAAEAPAEEAAAE